MTSFTPSGDLAIEYGLDDRATDATVWAYRGAARASAAGSRRRARRPIRSATTRSSRSRSARSCRSGPRRKPRDQVIVVDAGRAMFGERFARAKRLAVQITQEMDRRDRVTSSRATSRCKAMPGGFVAPGAPAAHDVDAFLAGASRRTARAISSARCARRRSWRARCGPRSSGRRALRRQERHGGDAGGQGVPHRARAAGAARHHRRGSHQPGAGADGAAARLRRDHRRSAHGLRHAASAFPTSR